MSAVSVPAPAVATLPSLPPVLPIGGAFLLGVAFGPARPDLWPLLLAIGVAAVACAALARTAAAWIAALAVLALAFGLWRATPPPPRAVRWPAAPVNAVRGVATTWPVASGESVRVTVAADGARTSGGWEPAGATLTAFLPPYPTVARGDTVIVVGMPALRPSGADATDGVLFGQSLRVVRAEQPAGADTGRRNLRERLIAGIAANVRAPEAGFAAGVLLGERSAIDARTRAALNATGTSQHVVISGWNIALIVGLLGAVARALGWERRVGWLGVSVGGIAAYTVVVGADSSVVRAAIMGAVGLIAPALGRRGDPLIALALAMAAMAAVNPAVVGDLAFLLSGAATFGVLVVAPWLARQARRVPLLDRIGWLTELIAVAVGAQLMTEPVIAHAFGRVSLVSPLVNVLVEPLVPAIMLGAGATALLALFPFGFPAAVAGVCTAVPAWLFLRIIGVAASLPGAALQLPQPGTLLTVLLYAVPAAIALWRAFLRPHAVRWLLTATPREAVAGVTSFAIVAVVCLGFIAVVR